MGFSLDYRSTRPVTAAEAEAIDQAAARLCDHPDWVGCEEISFYECLEAYGEGHLSGSSKPHLEAPGCTRSPAWKRASSRSAS